MARLTNEDKKRKVPGVVYEEEHYIQFGKSGFGACGKAVFPE